MSQGRWDDSLKTESGAQVTVTDSRDGFIFGYVEGNEVPQTWAEDNGECFTTPVEDYRLNVCIRLRVRV